MDADFEPLTQFPEIAILPTGLLKRPFALAAMDGGVAMQKPLAFDGVLPKAKLPS